MVNKLIKITFNREFKNVMVDTKIKCLQSKEKYINT